MEEAEVHELERHAVRALAEAPDYVWDKRSLPVPVEDIVDSHFGLQVREVDDLTTAPGCPPIEPGRSLSGLLLAGRWEIWVNAAEAAEWPGRRRFTIGHELGHWVLHRDRQASLFCRHGSVDPADGEADAATGPGASPRPQLPAIEAEANQFAAALLMPRPMVEARYRDLAGRPDRFQRLCSIFGVSGAAMGRRLHQVIPPGGTDGG